LATRLRLPASGTVPITPAYQSYTHARTDRRPMFRAADGDSTALADTAIAPDAADDLVAGDAVVAQFIGPPMVAGLAFTSGDAFKLAVQCLEANAGNNIQLQVFMSIISEDGTTSRGTIRSKQAEGTEVNTSQRNVFHSGTLSATVNTVEGDRLLVELSFTGTPTAAGGVQGHNGTMRFGSAGAGGDLPENDTETGSTFNPWIEVATNIELLEVHRVSNPRANYRQAVSHAAYW